MAGPDRQNPAWKGPAPEAMGHYNYAHRIFKSLRRLNRVLILRSRELSGHSHLTGTQRLVLREVLLREGCTPGALARSIYLSQPTVTVTLDRLEQRGLVRRERDSKDKRRVVLLLTNCGREEASSISLPLVDFLANELVKIPENKQADLAAALEQLAEVMEVEPPTGRV